MVPSLSTFFFLHGIDYKEFPNLSALRRVLAFYFCMRMPLPPWVLLIDLQ